MSFGSEVTKNIISKNSIPSKGDILSAQKIIEEKKNGRIGKKTQRTLTISLTMAGGMSITKYIRCEIAL